MPMIVVFVARDCVAFPVFERNSYKNGAMVTVSFFRNIDTLIEAVY